jgi:hypothetical protein
MVISATLMMFATMVFRLPYDAYSGIYVFQISRESQKAAIASAMTIVSAFGLSTVAR